MNISRLGSNLNQTYSELTGLKLVLFRYGGLGIGFVLQSG